MKINDKVVFKNGRGTILRGIFLDIRKANWGKAFIISEDGNSKPGEEWWISENNMWPDTYLARLLYE